MSSRAKWLLSRLGQPRPQAGCACRRRGRLSEVAGTVTSAALAAVAARVAYASLRRRPPGGSALWARTNHRGEPVTLLEGPAVSAAAVLTSALDRGLPPRLRAALTVAGTGAAGFGGYDDLAGSGGRRGFRGHIGALARGQVTTGAVKLGGIGASGLLASVLLGGSPADLVINTGLTAGTANLLNLFDLRPGRAIKVALAGGALLAAGGQADGDDRSPRSARALAAPLGAALALLPEDLGERAMLGDAGANALGALLGVAAAATLSRSARVALLAAITGLTAASEVVSFTAVIERTPALRWLDMLGRRPPAAASPPPAAGKSPASFPASSRASARHAAPSSAASQPAAPSSAASQPAAPSSAASQPAAASSAASQPADASPAASPPADASSAAATSAGPQGPPSPPGTRRPTAAAPGGPAEPEQTAVPDGTRPESW